MANLKLGHCNWSWLIRGWPKIIYHQHFIEFGTQGLKGDEDRN